ncbi:MAG: hypothetical protein K0S37_296 [Microbacterium sp.]|nr:hypothetical protein [Microbacterium sp.]
MRDEFRMDGEQLGLDRHRSSVVLDDSGTLTAELRATAVPSTASAWALSPPILYFRNVRLVMENGQRVLTINDDVLDEYDIALYFMEHHDVEGLLTLSSTGDLTVDGITRFGTDPASSTPIRVQWTFEG